jgi:hypothetical protein
MKVDYLDGPKLFVIHGFLSPQECDEFIDRSERFGYSDAPITTSVGFVMRKDIRDKPGSSSMTSELPPTGGIE